jgi:hypothetical protein
MVRRDLPPKYAGDARAAYIFTVGDFLIHINDLREWTTL